VNWEKLLEDKNLSYKDNLLTENQITDIPKVSANPVIDRHKTAISIYNFSKPVQTILEYNLLDETEIFFDYGCGLGDDLPGQKKVKVQLRCCFLTNP